MAVSGAIAAPSTVFSGPASLPDRIAALNALVMRPVNSTNDLKALLRQTYQMIADTDLSSADPQLTKPLVPELQRALFTARLALRSRITDWHAARLVDHTAQQVLRDCLRAARFASDMLGELGNGYATLADGAVGLKAFWGVGNTLVAPAFDTDEGAIFKSGDVLLMRGMHHNSAAIARIGDVDSQFSHACIIHIDADGRQWVVEALIEEGSVINPLGKTLTHGNGRAILLRHRDADLAARAAKIAYNHVHPTLGTFGRRIPYDFTMRLDERRPLFCSKLVWLAFGQASKGKLELPLFRTRFDMRNRDFLDRIGVKATESFAPGDIEIDTRFDVVAEWQDFRVTARLRAQDLIMVKLFEWMEVYGYTFRQDFLIRLISLFGRVAAHLSEGAKDLLSSVVPKVPLNMKRKTIAAIAMLHKTAEPLLAEITEAEARHIAGTGRPLHPREIFAMLEQIRQRSDGRIGYLVLPGA